MYKTKIICLLLGILSGLVFAPIFFIPALFTFSYLCYIVQKSQNWQVAAKFGYLFGFGHFLSGMYWISIGVSVYIADFWWAIPFALFGLPIILAFFISANCTLSFFAKNNKYYQLIFCLLWVLFEWIRSWILTGLPWNLIGYAFSFSEILIQPLSITGIYGLSFIVIYISTSAYPVFTKKFTQLKILLASSMLILTVMVIYGAVRVSTNPTNFTDIKVRLVQPSIPQTAKWDQEEFWHNLMLHINLSENLEPTDLIIWSEAALVVPDDIPQVKLKLLNMLNSTNAILITGGISDNKKHGDQFELYSAMYALDKNNNKLFEYHKSHLVPFGEYMPLKNILPFKKLTHGLIDYKEGDGGLVYIKKYHLKIKPLICYESIFPNFVRTNNEIVDVIINITNDAWYGKSSGPYQHFHISRSRAVENGLPMIRVANNGISAIVDPIGRIVKKLNLNEINYIQGLIPQKLTTPTIFSQFGNFAMLLSIVFIILIHYLLSLIFDE
ncbi:apolipoprotein N-acyltransferase [Rickettsia prowazekii]|uniref:Apolipoprotein N-acyltransferase n=2 Tax=Rickettsia prowazekii TaxID=782 RepID=LNT_RICPR|nr:apolipoprotein N-acyltransferase [Rickettsia prowazekii]Q9ZDG3.1 RecName: Full=Apolipoprotein N-acyltransferase; Short=ALP N-acyltransferase [Rickettsia prowazekii str. Madrid E]ADE29887.1 Apolipoprotein N-acyltransferase [Rickettsia prowazekii str. Rp22]AFE49181.1 apolipoprotein N-acyltransferase [Rickettsia prowazekii str. Chernikova]AFE50027.1 apolipoprotein N-acyltransferase [Rickettsia prowazekii str. Katsinyian]AFE50872.1 apolipoprotein N-acyltransferase [Rickettsia prowazekii str. Bu